MNAKHGLNLALALALAAPLTGAVAQGMMGGGQMMGMGGGMMGGSMVRRQYVMRNGLPEHYRNQSNPLSPTPENITAGKRLYGASCAVCHGANGEGNGAAAANMNPPPANLTQTMRTRFADDAYLDWTISEGGAPVGSPMPAFKSSLSQKEIWQIVLYLHQL